MKEAGEEVLGYRNNRKTEWISEETSTQIEERRQIKKRLLDSKSPRLKDKISKEYRGKDKEVKKSASRDRKEYTERLAKEADVAAGQKDMKTVYQNTKTKQKKTLKGDYSQHYDLPVRDEVGAYVTVEQDKLERWKKHFEYILNRPDEPVLADIPEAVDDLDVNCDDITVEEVKQAIHKHKLSIIPNKMCTK
ncbi:hypothetical protein ACJMK2_033367 [Sinanodonta woodiana]|uniref:Uncharacterized protein n=1 Tax=Sinanodonta woodiana TaxID=1069815 RepID=A0ABD3WN68_SINWO